MDKFYAPSTIFKDDVDSVSINSIDGEYEASIKVLAEINEWNFRIKLWDKY